MGSRETSEAGTIRRHRHEDEPLGQLSYRTRYHRGCRFHSGPGDPNLAHAADEHISWDDMFVAARVYASFGAKPST